MPYKGILREPQRERQPSTTSCDSGYGSSGSRRKKATGNANSHCGRHEEQYLFGGHSIGELWRSIVKKDAGDAVTDRTHDGGLGKPGLGRGLVQKCKGFRRDLKVGETGSKRKGEAMAGCGDEVKNEARAQTMATNLALPATGCSGWPSLTTSVNEDQQKEATKPPSISSHPASSDDELTGDDSEMTDSCDANSSDRTWSLASMSHALESPGVGTCTILTQYQARLVDNLMFEFHSLINSQGIVARSRAGSEGSSASGDGSSGSTSTAASSDGNKKRQREEPDAGNGRSDEDQGQDGEPPKVQRIHSPSPSTTSKKLACPYFRHNPANHVKYRSCAGPGWPTVHRVKEHVFRRHSVSIRCARCGEIFETEPSLEAHYRLPQRCEIQSDALQQPEQLTKEQEKALRKRKKFISEEEKWRDMYRILFPTAACDDGDMPSPYYDDASAQLTDEFQRYEQYLHRELPQLVRRRLEEAVSGFATPLENQLRSQLVDIVRNSQSELFRSYRSTATSNSTIQGQVSDSFPPHLDITFPRISASVGGGGSALDVSGNGAQEPNQRTALQDLDPNLVDPSTLVDFSAYGEPPTMDDEGLLGRLDFTDILSWGALPTTANVNGYTISSDSGYGSTMNEEFDQFSGSHSDRGGHQLSTKR